MYNVGESDGTMTLRIGVIYGTLADDIQVRLYTGDDTAQGEIYVPSCTYRKLPNIVADTCL